MRGLAARERTAYGGGLYLIFTLSGISLVLAYILTPIVRDRLGPLGFIDHPDGVRKKHLRPVPRVGGISIALSYAATFAIAFVLPFSYIHLLRHAFPDIWKLALAASVILLTGVLDDLVGLTAQEKLLGIVLAAVLAYWVGIRLDIYLLRGVTANPWLGFVSTVLWLVACTNAFNLIDGLDGLAAGLGMFATLTMLVAALTQHNLPLALATAPLAGCLLGFLRYNFSPASVFLGDGGSLLIGFLLGCYGSLWSAKCLTLVALVSPLLAVSVPLLEVALSVVRRFLRNRPIFQGDRGHMHHKLLDRGFSIRRAVLVTYGLCIFGAALSLFVNAIHNQLSGLIVILFCLVAWLGIQYLGYPEFGTAAQMFLKGGVQRFRDAEAQLLGFETAMAEATDIGGYWEKVREGSRKFGFHSARMCVAGIVFQDSVRPSSGPIWQLRIELSESEYVNFVGDLDSGIDALILNAFVRCVERGLKQIVVNGEPATIAMQPVSELVCAAGGEAGVGGAMAAQSSAD